MYIFDEPSIGLHMNDMRYILDCLYRLKDKGNTIIIVEHNLDIIRRCDYICDLGPGGGNEGGFLVATGSVKDIVKNKKSLTGKYLSRHE